MTAVAIKTTDGSIAEHILYHKISRAEMARIGFVALAIASSLCQVWHLVASFDFIALAAVILGGYPIFHEAWESLMHKRMTMELSMTIALIAAVSIGEFFTAAVIVLFVLVAEVLEEMTVARGRLAIKDLLSYLPQIAFLERANDISEIPISKVKAGDIVLVKPGARIPVDGIVQSGTSFVDESTITGESIPVEKLSDAKVYAGTINQSGALHIRTISVGKDTAFGKILQMVEKAEETRAPIENMADRLSGYIVYFAFACAVLTFLITANIRSTISVILVAGACGIAAGTPLAVLGAIGQAARKGVIVKGGIYIEQLAILNAIAFDKTGSLTIGKPKVISINSVAGMSEQYLLARAASAEKLSEHPLARAIQTAAITANLTIEQPIHFQNFLGKGVSAEVAGHKVLAGNAALLQEEGVVLPDSIEKLADGVAAIHIAEDGQYKGYIAIADSLRPEADKAVNELENLGFQTLLFTGDTKLVAEEIAKQAGIKKVYAELLPQQKAQYIDNLKASGLKIAMVGDGINDAAALVKADIGVAIGSGTDVALESADIMLISNDLLRFVEAIKIAKRCRRIILTNFYGTIAVDGIGMALAAAGFLNPLMAAFIHVTSELLFILNSASMLPVLQSDKKVISGNKAGIGNMLNNSKQQS